MNVMSVSLLCEATTGKLLLFYLRKDSLANCQVYVRSSEEEGEAWGPARLVSSGVGYHVMNNARVVQLASGRLLAPVALTPDFGASRHQTAFCYLSDDGAHTWRRGRGATDLPQSKVGCQEPGLVDLGGSVLMYIRTDLGHVYAAHSEDEGDTWDAPQPILALPAPAAPATMARLPDGGLVAIYNRREDALGAGWADRTPLAAARSDDEGRTWRRLADIEPSPDYCYGYTSIRFDEDSVLLTYYVWPRSAQAGFDQTGLRFRRMSLEHFT